MKKFCFMFATMFLAGSSVFAGQLTPGQCQAKSINAAKLIASRNLHETIRGLNLEFFEKISKLDANTHDSQLKSVNSGVIKGMRFATEYDAKRDLAIVHAEVDVAEIADLAPAWKNSSTQMVRRVGFASCNPATVKQLKTMRAAELDAYAKLLARVRGMELASKTTIENMMVKDDTISARLAGAVLGARLVTDPADSKDAISWSDNTENAVCTVTLELNLDDLAKIMGVKFVDKVQVIRVKGIGMPDLPPAKIEAKTPVKVVTKEKVVFVEKKVIVDRETAVRPVKSNVLAK